MRARASLALLVLLTLALPALAQDRRGVPSLDRVLPEIRRTTPGTFYDADGPFLGPDGQATYRIKWMTPDGRIIWFYADARTGRVMGVGGQLPPQADRFRYPGRRFPGWMPPGNGGGDRNQGGGWNRGHGRGGSGGDRRPGGG